MINGREFCKSCDIVEHNFRDETTGFPTIGGGGGGGKVRGFKKTVESAVAGRRFTVSRWGEYAQIAK